MEMEVGSVYQVDHSKLPSQAPNQLRLIRVVMVSKKTETRVSVTYPSEISLEAFFGDDDECGRRLSHGLMQPNLEEKYVMGLDVAEEVLFHQIPFEEFVARRGMKSFWVMDVGVVVSVPCKEPESCSVTDGPKNEGGTKRSCDDDDDDYEGDSGDGGAGRGIGLQVQWAKRRRATFIGKHKERISPMMSMLTVVGVENQEENMKVDKVKEEEEEEEEGWYSGREELKKRKGRAVFKCEKKKNKMMVMKTVQKKKKKKKKRWNNDQDIDDVDKNVSIKEGKGFNPKNRWTEDRYKKAEKNILKVMKAKGAVYGRPILRPDLRAEARKLIGDTGLLDHLLKHMAGKLAPGGKERFRRRHNPEGAMEYWLESAELVNVRKEAGVIDPYWNPPPGWQPGDSPSQDVVCAREIKMLKQDVADMKRKLEEMDDRNGKKQVLMIKGADDDVQNMDASILIPLKVTHEELLKRKAKIDEQLLLVSKALQGMEEDVGKLVLEATCKAPVASEPQMPMYNKSAPLQDEQDKIPAATKTATTETAKAETTAAADQKAAEKEARRQRLKSGFRICKPEGTFLWPANMAASTTTSNHLNLLLPSSSSSPFSAAVPTPPSVSSSSTFPPSRSLFFPPVKPIPERPKVVVATAAAAGGCLQLVKDNVRSPTATTDSFSRSSSSSSCISSCMVPDLNEVPAGGDYHHLVGFASIDPTPPLQMYKGTRVMHLLPCCSNGYCH